MAVSASVTHGTITIGEPTSGSEAATRGFVAVNNGSADESDVSSRLSSPHETVQRVGDVSSRPPSSGLYPLPQSHDENHHKRKRSGSDEGAKHDQQRQYSYTPPKRPEAQHMANRALRVLGNTDQNGSSYHVNGTGAESNGHSWPSPPGRSGHPPMHANGSSGPTSDAQLAEALQRETSAQEDQSRDWDADAQANGDADHEHFASDPQSGANMSGPERKRNFSNRTKTGCLTCRRRKKKCDEGHPICLNCKKGGFTCGGYSVTRGLWPAKPTPVKPPVRLQSKVDGVGDVSESSTYQPDRSADTSPNSARPSAQFDGGQRRSIPSIEHDHQRPQHYPPGPAYNETRTRAPYPVPPPPQPQQWPPQQSQSPYTTEHLPPLSDLGRPDTNSNPPSRDMSRPSTQVSPHSQAPPHPLPSSQAPPPPPPPPPSHQAPPPNRPSPNTHQPPGPPPSAYAAHAHPHQAPGPAPPHYGYGPPPPPPDTRHQYHPPPPEHHTPSHMRMSSASYDSHKSTARTFNKEDVERSKMLRHTAYNHFDPTLEDDRKRCQQALKRFNQAAELGSGVSVEEQRNILLKVFDPSKDTTHRFLAAPMEKGTLSHGVRIEYPFKCTYGYNVKIMDSVYIGSGCKFDDAGRVDIGARTWIGPGVTIVTTGVSEEMIDRKGSGGSWKASPVTIASEVVIGEGAKICPGVIIGKGATVEPFALVKENLGEYERQCADQGPRRR